MKRILTPVLLATSIAVASAAVVLAGQPANFGAEISAVAKDVTLVIEGSHGKFVSTQAKLHGAAISKDARAKGQAHAAAQGTNGTDASESGRLKGEAGAPS
jgi:hypothetical protein